MKNRELLINEIKRLKVFYFNEHSYFECLLTNNYRIKFFRLMKSYYKYRLYKNKISKFFSYRRYAKYSLLLNVQINCKNTLFGLLIFHQNVVIHGDAIIGKNLKCAGNNCIGGNAKGAPKIGDNVAIGFGAIVLGNVSVANGCRIGAGAVVTKNCEKENSKIVGINQLLQ